jgi:hypothetical protein
MSDAGSARARNLRTVGALAALYLVPLALAFYAYYGTGWRPAGHVNHGTLITPPRPLPELALIPAGAAVGAERGDGAAARAAGAVPAAAFRGIWTLVYIGNGACDAGCRRALLVMRQAHVALNRDMTRVGRVYLSTGACCARELTTASDPGLTLLDATVPAAAPLLEKFPAAAREHSVFVVDPLGNLMMSYDARTDARGLLIDLQKLLRLSHIG